MNPTGLALDDHGNLYISSRNDGAVYRLSTAGDLSTYAEGMGVATGLAFDELGNLYVGDRSGTIFKIAPDRQIFVFATLEPSVAAYHLAFSPNGNLYVTGPTTSSNDCVYEIDQHGVVTPFFSQSRTSPGPRLRPRRQPLRRRLLARPPRHHPHHAGQARPRSSSAEPTSSASPSIPTTRSILATTSAAYFLPWSIPGFIVTPELPEP